MTLSGTKFSLGFSFSMTLSSSPIRQSPDDVWVVFVPTSLCLFNLKVDIGGRGGAGGGGTNDGCCEKLSAWLSKKKSLRVGGWKGGGKYVGGLGGTQDGGAKKSYSCYCYCHFLCWKSCLFHEVY